MARAKVTDIKFTAADDHHQLDSALGWRLASLGLGCALALDVMAMLSSLTGIKGAWGQEVLATLMLQAGWWLLLGVLLYGVRLRSRWGWWSTMVVSVPVILLIAASTQVKGSVGSVEVANSPAQVALTVLEMLALIVTVGGLFMVRKSLRRP